MVSAVPPDFGDRDDTGVLQIDGAEQRRQGVRIHIIEKMQARTATGRPEALPEALVRQSIKRLPAQRRTAGAEHHHVAEAPAPIVGQRTQRR